MKESEKKEKLQKMQESRKILERTTSEKIVATIANTLTFFGFILPVTILFLYFLLAPIDIFPFFLVEYGIVGLVVFFIFIIPINVCLAEFCTGGFFLFD